MNKKVFYFRKEKRCYTTTRTFSGSGKVASCSIECPGLLFQRGLSLRTIEQLELLLLAEGFTKHE